MVQQTYIPKVVLLIEDSSDDEMLALRALQRCNVPVVTSVARDGYRALRALGLNGQLAVSRGVTPDLVISDLKMPKLNGDEVLKLAREHPNFADVPFVIFSSSDDPADISRCQQLGASEYAVKPVDFRKYMGSVEKIVDAWLGDEGRDPAEGRT